MMCFRETKNQKAIADMIRKWVEASNYDEIFLAQKLNLEPERFYIALCGYWPFRKFHIYRLVKILNPPKNELHELYFNMAFDEKDLLWFSVSDVWSKLDQKQKIKALESLDKIADHAEHNGKETIA